MGSKKVREVVREGKITMADLKTVSPTDKFFAKVKTEKGQALTPSALTGITAAIHCHLTRASLSRNKHFARQRIHIFQHNV